MGQPIHHVSLEVGEDPTQELRFWGLLGFSPVDPPPGLTGRTRWLERDGFQVHLIPVARPVIPAEGHLALVEPELGRVRAALEGVGFEVVEGEPYWGKERIKATSPTGHLVELMAGPPA